MSNGCTLYAGPSRIDGSPIALIATGLPGGDWISANSKTGPVVQSWIIRTDMHPGEATRQGPDAGDVSICGTCPLRRDESGTRRCYVGLYTVSAVWKAYTRGAYPVMTPDEFKKRIRSTMVRWGSYGDMASLPEDIALALLAVPKSHTMYTHQWATADWLRPYAMASVETEDQANDAWARGWRTFRIGDRPVGGREISCPASAEAGHVAQCADCRLCDGAAGLGVRKSIVIQGHGRGWSPL